MLVSTFFTVMAAGLATAAPLDRRGVKLDDAATAEAQKFDATATRAFTATTITTSDGKCLSVDPFSGDFRENLTPINVAACDGSKNQTWDVITAGVHNNVKGQALIVSSLTNACLNFDARRAPGNQVLLFSCGGRADGGGQVTDSQLFAFTGAAGPQALTPQNGKGTVCLSVKGNLIDQTACNGAASATGAELFTFGGKAAATTQDSATTAVATTAAATECAAASTVTKTVTVTLGNSGLTTDSVRQTTTITKASTTTAATNTVIKVSGAGGTLNPTAVAEAQKKDDTATRAATGVEIKDSMGSCLTIDETAGDFHENLIPVAVKACDGSDGQKFDLFTKSVHNDQAGKTLIVSSLTNGCLSFDPRRDQDKVHVFSCGGRGDGSGQVTDSQLFPFSDATLTAAGPISPSNAKGTCFVNINGSVQPSNCDVANPAANQLFTIGSASGSAASNAGAASTTLVQRAPAATTTATATTTTKIKVSGAGGTLNPTAVAESQKKDLTATRAATGVQIKSSDGQCLSIDPTAGNFRENLIPVAVAACDGSDGQKFDFVTKGVHNDKAGQTLIISSLTNGCLSFDARKALTVHLFSCGGRADGSGKVTSSQLFPFVDADLDAPYALTPSNGKGVCFVNKNGILSNVDCDAANPAANELFTIVA
ncbi:hypothetical protein DFH08DRAFT_753079 [Mycena albidolilacea]|uniref:Ricin B lectin domain-containing protein n=1 Tax=Mycena albidolilacea TaxID=1033008 RepID=A0AAD6ZHJ8_9AGAR|nr:hypothetical protein DFH08DRAFT_753079 [Mycena albidolilacea]